MFSFKRKSSFKPVKPHGYEGMGIEGRIAFSNAEHTWEESFNLVDILKKTLLEHDYTSTVERDWIIVNKNLHIHPEIVTFQPIEPNGVRSVTSIAISNEKYAPNGLFEYQHSAGDDTNQAIAKGFKGWIELDLPVLLDAINNSLVSCTAMDMEYPAPEHRIRRALLGPVSHIASRNIDGVEEHPFCPCCLLTNSFEAFREHFKQNEFFGIRLLVLRNENGEINADCRVNGIDWELGKEHLIKYGQTWPGPWF